MSWILSVIIALAGALYSPTVSDAKAYALQTLGPEQYACLDMIISAESQWNPLVWNRSGSNAYGLGQAKPPSKMAPYGIDYMTNPLTQIRWAIAYSIDRYGSPCEAVYFRAGWYDRNGVLHPGHGWW